MTSLSTRFWIVSKNMKKLTESGPKDLILCYIYIVMNHKEELVERGKELSYLLRHSISEYELGWINEHGWMPVQRLIDQYHYTSELIEEIVATNNKQHYEFNEDHTKIRACQGHSIPVDVELKETTPPDVLYHGTAERFLDSIMNEGIKCMSRLYVHLSDNYQLAKEVGKRHGKPAVLEVDAKKMMEDGHKFYLSNNNVWLTKHVDPKYIREI